jgi:hypothetical protein
MKSSARVAIGADTASSRREECCDPERIHGKIEWVRSMDIGNALRRLVAVASWNMHYANFEPEMLNCLPTAPIRSTAGWR